MGFLDLIVNSVYYAVEVPVNGLNKFMEWQQSKREPAYWYHRQYRRVTPIEDCRMNDLVCMFEAEEQYKRDKKVEEEIMKILQTRMDKCAYEEGVNAKQNCKDVLAVYEANLENFFTKYNGLGGIGTAMRCMLKQKYRVYEERKNEQEAQGSS